MRRTVGDGGALITLVMRKNYLNLTNGIEAIPCVSDYSFIRIQSTACEQHHWDQILQDLDYDFLMSCALGYDVYVYDFGANKPKSRALYQGLEFVKYVLNKRWYDKEYITNVSRGTNQKQNSNRYFREVYDKLEDRTKKKLDYFKPFLSGNLSINAVFGSTAHDGDKQFYKEFLYSC